jgi:hypothetical protein
MINLAFMDHHLAKFRTSWGNSSPPTGSDHFSPQIKIFLSYTITPYTTLDLNNMDWNTSAQDFRDLTIPDFSLHDNQDT